MRVVVVGAGIGGLGSALALARSGHSVTILERDATPMPESADAAFEWQRRGAPQVRHSHALLARLRNLLHDRAPDVLAALLAAGATEMSFMENPPETLTDHEPRVGDDELVALACRRTTFEWVLRHSVLATPGVELRDGIAVEGIITLDVVDGRAPIVTGARTNAGDIAADFVIDATGPRTASPRWLADAKIIEPDEELVESEIVYLSRFYRLREGHEQPDARGPIGGDLGYLKYAVFLGDNRSFSMTFAVDSDDKALRTGLASVAGFEGAARQLVAALPWIDGRSEPITDVHVMAGLRNRKRHFVRDGAPIVLGFAAVGDASVCTNPLYGRGCSLALVHAYGLADLIDQYGDDFVAISIAFDGFTRRELDPWFKAAVQQDQEAIAQRHKPSLEVGAPGGAPRSEAAEDTSGGDPEPLGARAQASGGEYVDPKAWAREVFRDGLLPATRTSPIVFRAFLRWFNLLATPDALMNDPEVIGAALQAYQARDSRPPEPAMGPATREVFLAALEL